MLNNNLRYLLISFIIFILLGCAQDNGLRKEDKRITTTEILTKRPPSPPSKEKSVDLQISKDDEEKAPHLPNEKNVEKSSLPINSNTHNPNQDLLDSAMEFIQASNGYWEKGDLENAIAALDKAYSLILQVNDDPNSELLQQKEDLRFTISKRIIEVYSSRFTAVNGSYKAIPLTMNKYVKQAIRLFQGRERNFFLKAYSRSGRYRPAILKALRESGLPEELSWLPLIESGFNVRAMSRARALGLWQFIASTGYKFGLKRDRWVDERLDPEKSTKAAIAYLKELHQIFGDWTTVLAAYNCGELRVLRCIREQKINYLDNFWDLYNRLPQETAFYVPKFLAVLHILNDPKKYGFELPPLEKEINTEEVTINKQVHLKTIAKILKINFNKLKDLNPELRYYLTPNRPYNLKVPSGKGEILLAKMKDIPVWKPRVPPFILHKVRKGETLSLLAKRYRTTISSIMRTNGLRNKDYLKVGWVLKIPTWKTTQSTIKSRSQRRSTQISQVFNYVVKEGDSLWKIARKFGTTTDIIYSLNNLRSPVLRVGQVLKIASLPKGSNHANTIRYRVKKGDSPYLIAKRYRMDLYDFLNLNNLTPRSIIFPGQVVLVRTE
jgi:membrane-bound lytic murein transglycosylase D